MMSSWTDDVVDVWEPIIWNYEMHYSSISDVILSAMESLMTSMFTPQFIQAHSKENIKAPREWPLWGGRWIPLTKDQ